MDDVYKTVSCQFYDELEALAVKKIKSKIFYMDNENEKYIEDLIVDFNNSKIYNNEIKNLIGNINLF